MMKPFSWIAAAVLVAGAVFGTAAASAEQQQVTGSGVADVLLIFVGSDLTFDGYTDGQHREIIDGAHCRNWVEEYLFRAKLI